MNNWSFQTKAIHSGISRDSSTGSTTVPIYQTASFSYPTADAIADVFNGRKYGHVYSRISNPTVAALESRLTALENGVGAIALASGMAAITAAVETLCQAGDHIVASSGLFGGTLFLFKEVMARRGITVTFVDLQSTDAIRQAVTDSTKLVFVEIIGNPKMDVADVRAIADIAHEFGIPLIVDNTLTTAYCLDAKSLGADIVVNCLGKFVAGNGNAIGGAIIDLGNFNWATCKSALVADLSPKFGKFAFIAAARKYSVTNTGACMAPMNAFLFLIGIESLGIRVQRHCENALQLASFLSDHPRQLEVRFPGLPSHPQAPLVSQQFGGLGGALLTIRVGSKDAAFRLLGQLKLVSNAANLGDAKTLAIHMASTIYKDFSAEEQESGGVYSDLIRVS
ncbi:O-acetylhomoserine aminocarboxypropyltransferase/cysteine synthase, partial [bacterium]|nr:O-acetylhomoserine aminocarboxypropyltransferase/cysteine synthase [bacterium]